MDIAMTDDLVERLRHCSQNTRDEYLHELTGRAADRIEVLEAALRTIMNEGGQAEHRIAAEALKEIGDQ